MSDRDDDNEDDEAKRRRDIGMATTAAHAESEYPGWIELAVSFVGAYALTHRAFLAEECREAADAIGFVEPPNTKAWRSGDESGRESRFYFHERRDA